MAPKKQPAKEKEEQPVEKGTGYDVSYRVLLRESMHGYVFWSLFQGLGPMIWFYPLNELDISGYEAYAGLWFIQLVTGIPGVLGFFQRKWSLILLRLLMVASLASFQAPDTLTRLITLALGNGIAMITLTATLWNPSQRVRCKTVWGLLLGLLMYITSRIWLKSFVPTWWSDTTNTLVITLGAVAVIDQIMSGSDEEQPSKKSSASPTKAPSSLLVGVGFGSLMYLTHWCFGEVSLITRWVVRSYPDHGPLPNPWGIGTLLALGLGIYMSACRHMATSKVWWLLGTTGICGLYYLPRFYGYTGGLLLAVYTMSIWPEMLHRLSLCPPARTLAIVIITYLVQIFFFVWTVAYNFVPGGVYTRERTDVLIATVMIGIALGLFSRGGKEEENHSAYMKVQEGKMPSMKINLLLVLTVCAGLLGFATRQGTSQYNHMVKGNPRQFTAAIWTYHFGYDNFGWPSLERTKVLLNNTEADVITLLESDASKPFLGNNDLAMWLGEELGMYVDFGPATKDHTWGNLILSKHPIVKSTHHLLPSPEGELAPAITATINITGRLVDFVVTHMGNDRDKLDRQMQAEFLAKELKESENPTVFLGYVTSAPGSAEYDVLLEDGEMEDIDDTDRDRWCEYIFYKKLIRLGFARVSRGQLSDTEVQIGRFLIPEDPEDYEDHINRLSDISKVPEDVTFSEELGEWYAYHGSFPTNKFHMATPKYFQP